MIKSVFIALFSLCFSSLIGQHTVNSISFYGKTKNKLSYLENYLTCEKGEPATRKQLEGDRKNLVNLPKYGHVHLKVDTLENQFIDVVFELYEVQTVTPIFDIGGIKENVYWQLGIANSSSLGVGIGYNASYRNTDNRSNYNLNVKYPFIKGKSFGLEAVTSRDASVEPVYFRGSSVNYNYTKKNAAISGLIYITPRNVLKLTGSYFIEGYEVNGVNESGFPTGFTHSKLLFSEDFLFNNEDYYYYYVNGFSVFFKLTQVVNLSESSSFNLSVLQFKYYNRLKKRGNLAVRFQFGVATNTDSPFAPFVLDSNLNIRGSGNRQERGTASGVTNVEYRHTIWGKNDWAIQSNVFADSGFWRNPGEDLTVSSAKESLRVFAGGGFRLIYKKFSGATFRIDYGIDTKNMKHKGFVFGVGQYF